MKTEYEVLRDALIECYESATETQWPEAYDTDDDDVAEMAITSVQALRDAFNESEYDSRNDIE